VCALGHVGGWPAAEPALREARQALLEHGAQARLHVSPEAQEARGERQLEQRQREQEAEQREGGRESLLANVEARADLEQRAEEQRLHEHEQRGAARQHGERDERSAVRAAERAPDLALDAESRLAQRRRAVESRGHELWPRCLGAPRPERSHEHGAASVQELRAVRRTRMRPHAPVHGRDGGVLDLDPRCARARAARRSCARPRRLAPGHQPRRASAPCGLRPRAPRADASPDPRAPRRPSPPRGDGPRSPRAR
jgi:hypothetical protein